MTRRRQLLEAAAVLALLAIGAALKSSGSITVQAVGYAVMGAAGVLAVSAIFYEVGRSEDDERARRR